MVKINVLVLEREHIIRSKGDFEKELATMRQLFNNHEGGMMVRVDLTDSYINRFHEDRVFGKGIKDFYAKYGFTPYNYASDEFSNINLLGLVETSYTFDDVEGRSEELKKILDTVDTTTALFNYKEDEDLGIISTFDTIRKGFVEFNPDDNIAKKQRDYIVVKGIPEMIIVLCTVTDRREDDLKNLKEHIKDYLVLPSITEIDEVLKANGKLKIEIDALKDVNDSIINNKFIKLNDSVEIINSTVNDFITDMKNQKASILQVMHTLNAIGKSEIKSSHATNQKRIGDIVNLDDLTKLTCVI